jgi:hypothetical protein
MAYITSEPVAFKVRSNRYDANLWLDGQEWIIEHDKDFTSLTAVRAAIRNAAAKANLQVRIRVTADGNLYVRSLGAKPAKPATEHQAPVPVVEAFDDLPQAA